jgi:hypothetical protein
MDWASQYGHVAVLEWWKNSGLECKWSKDAMDWASCCGHVAVLEWWKNSGLECKWSKSVDYEKKTVREWWKTMDLHSTGAMMPFIATIR